MVPGAGIMLTTLASTGSEYFIVGGVQRNLKLMFPFVMNLLADG
jgi:hypothetical protein